MFFNRYLFVNETVCTKKLREMNIFSLINTNFKK